MTAMNWKNRRRVLAVHEHLHRIEVGRLSRLEREARELKAEEERIVSYLDENREMIAIFPEIVLQRLKANIQQQQNVLQAVERQATVALEQAKRVKQAERLVEKAERERYQEFERQDLREIIERVSWTADISAP
jgi:NCAIR mutase (PurE)-related protein